GACRGRAAAGGAGAEGLVRPARLDRRSCACKPSRGRLEGGSDPSALAAGRNISTTLPRADLLVSLLSGRPTTGEKQCRRSQVRLSAAPSAQQHARTVEEYHICQPAP